MIYLSIHILWIDLVIKHVRLINDVIHDVVFQFVCLTADRILMFVFICTVSSLIIERLDSQRFMHTLLFDGCS